MKRTSKSPLFDTFRKAFSLALEANKLETDSKEVIEQHEAKRQSRRQFLEHTGKAALIGFVSSLSSQSLLGRALSPNLKPTIAIVGGGMAGLHALHILKKAGYEATVYEASGRTGGRILSVQNAMGNGTWAEFGGEFIDTNHKDIWDLAKEFNLELIDYGQASENKLTKEAFFFEGQHRTLQDVVTEFRGFANRIKSDADRLPDNLSYKTKHKHVKKLDNLSISEYLEKIGAKGWIKQFIEVAYESEYGLSPQVQSSINLIWLISTDTKNGFELFGESDERYKIRGGNQTIPDAIAKKYPNNIELNRSLEAISLSGTQYSLQFSGSLMPVKADYVIMCLPFSRLRLVDIRLELPDIKRKVIDTLGFGTNAKLMLGMNTHFWRQQNYQGLCYADNGIPNGWDNSQLQTPDNEAAGLSILFGGDKGVALGEGTVDFQKDKYLPKWEEIFKGATANFSGKMARMHWPTQEFTLGSYICYTTGQYTSISGAEAMPVGRLLFAGEHCGGEFSGFMNGAAKSGREAAETIING